MTEHRPPDRRLVRIGAIAGIAGSLLAMVGNLLHPQTPTGDPLGVAEAIAGSASWMPVHLTIVFGLILMLGGLVAIYDAITAEPARALARLGYIAAVCGITVGLVLVILDGLSAKHLADAAVVAPPDGRAIALGLVVVEESINFALVGLFNILFAGVTFILFGLAVVRSRAYPAILGWVVVVAGAGSIIVGVVQGYLGESTGLTQTLTIIFPTVITAWVVLMGVLLLRRTRRDPGPGEPPYREDGLRSRPDRDEVDEAPAPTHAPRPERDRGESAEHWAVDGGRR